jgi:hypothetical protein
MPKLQQLLPDVEVLINLLPEEIGPYLLQVVKKLATEREV